jgi:Ni2+-binding GTPase involved in maturation of urease and hydrogenase
VISVWPDFSSTLRFEGGVSLQLMEQDAQRMRGDKPWLFTSLWGGTGLPAIVAWVTQPG